LPCLEECVFQGAFNIINFSKKRELLTLLKLGWPILVAQFCQTAMGAVDTIMAGHYGVEDLAAVALGYSFWLPAMLAMTGLLMATTPLVAHAIGARDTKEASRWLQQSLWMSLLLGVLVFLFLYNARLLFNWFDVPPNLGRISSSYLQAIACGMPAALIFQALRSFNEGLSQTKIIMYVGLSAFLINIPLNYLFIYGEFGFPELGGVGCGVASGLVMWFEAFCLWIYSRCSSHPAKKQAWLRSDLPLLQWQKNLFLLGFPIAVALFVEVGMFSCIALLLAKSGQTVIAAHQIALNVTGVIFMIPLSISLAMTIRIGYFLGGGNHREARLSRQIGQHLAIYCAVFNCLVMALLGPAIVAIYTPDQAIQKLAASLLLIAAVYQIPDALQISANGALRGRKDTAVPMVILIVSYWLIALPSGIFLAGTIWNGNPLLAHGYWWALVVGLTVAAWLLNLRLRSEEARFS
jgi:MATE family multidrug resistance protein